MLSLLGYHVGEIQPTPRDTRLRILEYAFECYPLGDVAYYSEWGKPSTPQRLKKLANTLAALTRNAKRRDRMSWEAAIDDWEHDLWFLYQNYYVDLFHFGWPSTDLSLAKNCGLGRETVVLPTHAIRDEAVQRRRLAHQKSL
jgi:hypothetical protein